MRTRVFAVLLIAVFAWTCSTSVHALPSDEAIREILRQRVDVARQATGIVVGIVDATGRRVITHGTLSASDQRTVDGDTVFEIGSVTKVFTALLLADMARRGEVSLDAPLSELLPSEKVRVPKRNGQAITLMDLSTQHSGLPRLPSNFRPSHFGDIYADYSVEQMYDFLSGYTLSHDPGTRYEYSNFGVGLLGHALALRANSSYQALLHERVTGPLGMRDTGVTPMPASARRLAVGHSWSLTPVQHWTSSTLTGAGFLSSTANDLMRFLEVMIGLRESPLEPAIKSMLAVRRAGGFPPATSVALGWMVASTGQSEFAWHPGRTGGYLSFVGFDRQARIGVVVLANAATRVGIHDIGLHLLDVRTPLADPKPPRVDTSLALDPKAAERFVGRYRWTPAVSLVLTREAGRLFLQAGSPHKFELLADGAGGMFMKEVPSSISFDEAVSGAVRAINVRLFGQDFRAWRE